MTIEKSKKASMSLDCPFLLNESYLKGLDYNKVEIILFIFGKEIHVLNKLNYKETQTFGTNYSSIIYYVDWETCIASPFAFIICTI